MKAISYLIAAFSLVAAVHGGAQTLVVSNLSETPVFSDVITSQSWRANKFVTGFTHLQISAIQLSLNSDPSLPDGLNVSVFTDISGYPGEQVLTLTRDVSNEGHFIFRPSIEIELIPHTSYWIVTSMQEGFDELRWNFTLSDTFTTASGWNVPTSNSFASSGTWGETWETYSSENYIFSVTAIPEPRIYVLLLMGSGLMVYKLGLTRRCSQPLAATRRFYS